MTWKEERNETIDRAAELVNSNKLNKRFEATVYHGFRSKKTLEEIKEEGITYYANTYAKARMDAAEVLKHFGFNPKYRFSQGESKGDSWRWSIWVTTYEPDVCGWASRSPEATFLTLDYAYNESDLVPNWNEIARYKTERYGRPIASKLLMSLSARSIFGNPSNINTEKKRIKPSEIVSLSYCEDQTVRV